MPYSIQMREEARSLYIAGLHTNDISSLLGVHPVTAWTWIKDISRGKSGSKKGINNPMWAGDNVSNKALHSWVFRNKPKPDKCQCCNDKAPMDLANISQEYRRDLNDFEWLCRKCHMTKDGRIKNLKQGTYDPRYSSKEM